MANRKQGNVFGRIVLLLVGFMMIALSLMNVLLFIFGDNVSAQVSTRRVGGARDGYPANSRYEWSIDYTFRAENGQNYFGTTTRRGSDTAVNYEKTVYYFKVAPFLNSLASEVKPNMGQIVMVGLGIFLLYVAIRKPG